MNYRSSKLYPFPLYSANIFSSSRMANERIKITTFMSKFPIVRFSWAQYSYFFASLLLKRPRLETLKLFGWLDIFQLFELLLVMDNNALTPI